MQDTTIAITQLGPELLARLDALAASLGVTARHLWGVLVRQAYVTWTDAIISFIVLVTAVTVGLKLYNYYTRIINERETAYNNEEIVPLIGSIICGIVGIIGILALIISTSIAINATLNPEYYALSKVLEIFGK